MKEYMCELTFTSLIPCPQQEHRTRPLSCNIMYDVYYESKYNYMQVLVMYKLYINIVL